jgi:hypothetical protein
MRGPIEKSLPKPLSKSPAIVRQSSTLVAAAEKQNTRSARKSEIRSRRARVARTLMGIVILVMGNTFVLKAAECPSGARFADSNFRLSTENGLAAGRCRTDGVHAPGLNARTTPETDSEQF